MNDVKAKGVKANDVLNNNAMPITVADGKN